MKGASSQEAAGVHLFQGPAVISGTGRTGCRLPRPQAGPTLGSGLHLLSPRLIYMEISSQLEG